MNSNNVHDCKPFAKQIVSASLQPSPLDILRLHAYLGRDRSDTFAEWQKSIYALLARPVHPRGAKCAFPGSLRTLGGLLRCLSFSRTQQLSSASGSIYLPDVQPALLLHRVFPQRGAPSLARRRKRRCSRPLTDPCSSRAETRRLLRELLQGQHHKRSARAR